MKKIVLALCAIVLLFASCKDKPETQSFPFSTVYTADELKTMLNNFYGMKPVNVDQPEMVVIEKFKNHFPEAFGLDWKQGHELYLVDFEIKGIDYDAIYDKQGDLLMCIYDIPQ